MKHLKVWIPLLAIGLVLSCCAKVEVLPATENALLPLAKGNQWTYVDSFFTTTTMPSNDTLVWEASYLVTRSRSLDRFVQVGKHGKELQRMPGWELINSFDPSPTTLIPLGDTLFSAGLSYFLYPLGYSECNRIVGDVVKQPLYHETNSTTGMFAGLVASPSVGDSFAYHPLFQNIPSCIGDLGPLDATNVLYTVQVQPLVASDSLVSLTTPAGTFLCTDFGAEHWAVGVGMVMSEYTGETTFTDLNHIERTGTIRWKRTLKSYTLY